MKQHKADAIEILKSIEYIDVSDYLELDTKWNHCPECGYKEPDGHWKDCSIGLLLERVNSLVVEDEQDWSESFSAGVKHGRILEQNLQETDKEISLRKWEEYCDEIYSQAVPGHEVPAFPDWLKDRRK